jgi:hypothetical protein
VSSWVAVVGVMVIAAGAVTAVVLSRDDDASQGLEVRPPAAAPRATRLREGDGAWIAVPKSWIVASDPGSAFPALRRVGWGTPLAATDPANVGNALLLVPLSKLAHDPVADADRFWSDQLEITSGVTRSEVTPLAVHGYRANQVTLTGEGAVVAAAIDTGDRIFLVAVRSPSSAGDAEATFERIIQTFDAR